MDQKESQISQTNIKYALSKIGKNKASGKNEVIL